MAWLAKSFGHGTEPIEAESRQDDAAPPPSERSLALGKFDFDRPEPNVSSVDGSSNPDPGSPLAFPPLFDEADDMLNLSNLVYVFAELRDLARRGGLTDQARAGRMLELPLPLDAALEILVEEGATLKDALDDGAHKAALDALKALQERRRERLAASSAKNEAASRQKAKKNEGGGLFGWVAGWCDGKREDTPPHVLTTGSSSITAMGDEKNQEELVYAVGINAAEERITVAFRGSVTKKDFMVDATIGMHHVPHPKKFHDVACNDEDEVGVHQGFHDYLFGDRNGGKMPSKYAEIVAHIRELMAEDPARKKYKLYVTGHSLGGALATLFGFYVSCSTLAPLPVTVVSVASPRVGNVAFARAFAQLESLGKLRHLRIANHKDPVTLGPTMSSRRAVALSAMALSPLGYLALKLTGNDEGGEEEVYYHTGVKAKLYRRDAPVGSCEIFYSGATVILASKNERPMETVDKDDKTEMDRLKKESSKELPMVSYHYGTSYSERLAGAEPDLRGLTLSDLYREKALGIITS